MSIVWLDGELVDKADAKVGVADHGLLFGDSVSVDMRAYGGRVFRLSQHLLRLRMAATESGLSLPLTDEGFAAAVDATLKASGRTDGFVKVVVTRGAGPLTLDPRKCVPLTIIFVEEAAPFPRELYDSGLDVVTCLLPSTAGIGPPVASARGMVKAHALTRGCLEGIAVMDGVWVVAGSETDVGLVRAGTIQLTRDSGATHGAVFDLAIGLGCNLQAAVAVRDSDLTSADEVFLTSAAAEIIAVRSIDGKPIGGGGEGPVVRRLREAFRTLVRAECAVS